MYPRTLVLRRDSPSATVRHLRRRFRRQARRSVAKFAALTFAATLFGLFGLVAAAPPAVAATQNCGFATPGTGTYASTICWFDLSGYNASQATSSGGQAMTMNLPNGYTLTFTLMVSGGAVKATTMPTYSGAFLGKAGYTGIPGDPALYQTTSGTTTTATLTNITMTDSASDVVTGYSLVGADAESTDSGETLTWNSSNVINSLTASSSGNGIGNACGGGFTGVGTTTVVCTGKSVGNKTGAPILSSDNPSTFSQVMVGGGLEGIAFGVLVSEVELDKTVVNGFTGDSFGLSVANSSGTVLATANTNGGTSASTGQVTVIVSAGGSQFTLAEAATAGSLANYGGSWSCTRNGSSDSSLPSGNVGATATITVQIGDFVDCTITNTADNASLSLTKHAATPVDVNHDGLVDAGDTIAYTFTVTNTGDLEIDNVGISDAKVGSVTCPQPSLAAGDSETCTADSPYTITAADVSAGTVHNSATASGSVSGSADGTVTSPTSTTDTSTTAPAPALTVVKSVLPTSVSAADQTVTYSFLVTNTGNVTISGVSIDDIAFSGTGSLSSVSCPPGAASLVPTASVTCTATYQTTQADMDAGSVSNTADASGTDPAGDTVTSPSSTTSFSTTAAPALTVVKSASPSGTAPLSAGEMITYSFVVTNTGNITLTDVSVDEGSFTGTGTLSSVSCPPAAASLAPGDQVTCTATYTVTQADVDSGSLTNAATATGTPPAGDGGPITSPPSTVVVPSTPQPALTVVKSASPATISKLGQQVTFSFLVTNTGNVTITTVGIVEKKFTGSGTLSAVTCPAGADALLPSAQVTCTATYNVTQADLDNGRLSNTATAGGDDPAGAFITSPPSTVNVPSTAVSKLGLRKTARAIDVNHDKVIDVGDRIDWTIVVTNLGATTITDIKVSDPTAGDVSCPETTLAPGAKMTCTVPSHTITTADAAAGQVRNTATAVGRVLGKVPISSTPAHVSVKIGTTPNPNGRLPFTGFGPTRPLVSSGVALVVVGLLLVVAAGVRRPHSD